MLTLPFGILVCRRDAHTEVPAHQLLRFHTYPHECLSVCPGLGLSWRWFRFRLNPYRHLHMHATRVRWRHLSLVCPCWVGEVAVILWRRPGHAPSVAII